MKAVSVEWVDVNKGIVTIVSDTTPSSLTITGADVDGLKDDYVIAAGSVLVTPDENYIAFADGEFTQKGNSGGGGGGGGGTMVVHFDPSIGKEMMDTTFGEIYEAIKAGKFVSLISPADEESYTAAVGRLVQTYHDSWGPESESWADGAYVVMDDHGTEYWAASPNDYPRWYDV